MKKLIIIIICLISFLGVAQSPKERIKTLKTAFITKEISLTEDEAKIFWPIYETYDQDLEDNRRKLARKIQAQSTDVDKLSKKEAKQLVADYLKIEKALYQAQEELVKKLENILSPHRVVKLLIAEKKFNQRMLQRFRDRE